MNRLRRTSDVNAKLLGSWTRAKAGVASTPLNRPCAGVRGVNREV